MAVRPKSPISREEEGPRVTQALRWLGVITRAAFRENLAKRSSTVDSGSISSKLGNDVVNCTGRRRTVLQLRPLDKGKLVSRPEDTNPNVRGGDAGASRPEASVKLHGAHNNNKTTSQTREDSP